jgi:hypothetical protein
MVRNMEYLAGVLAISWPLATIFIVLYHIKIAKKISPNPKFRFDAILNTIVFPNSKREPLPFSHEEKYAAKLIKNRNAMIVKIFLYFAVVSIIILTIQSF